jgi:hypothetical protein
VKRVFKDNKLQAELEENGYVLVPFLNPEETARLKNFYYDNPLVTGSSYHSTVLSTDIGYRKNIHAMIKEIFARALDTIFLPQYRLLFGTYTVKEHGKDSQWNVHQDWSFVDERKHTSVGVWCPAIDLNYDNGCLGVVKGSHKFFFNVRGTNTISEYSSVSQVIEKNHLTFVPVKAGSAVIFYNSLIHYSPPNLTQDTRITGNCVMLPKEAQVLHYFRDKSWDADTIEPFEIDTDFLIHNNYTAGQRPQMGKSLGKRRHVVKELTEQQINYLVRRGSGKLLNRIISAINPVSIPDYPDMFAGDPS